MWARFFSFLANLMNGLFKDVNENVCKLKLYLEENRTLKVINHWSWKNNRNYFVVYVKFWLRRLINNFNIKKIIGKHSLIITESLENH